MISFKNILLASLLLCGVMPNMKGMQPNKTVVVNVYTDSKAKRVGTYALLSSACGALGTLAAGRVLHSPASRWGTFGVLTALMAYGFYNAHKKTQKAPNTFSYQVKAYKPTFAALK